MKIKTITSEHRNDFSAIMECEHCAATRKNRSGYHDGNYHDNVIPAMHCRKCGKNRAGDSKAEAAISQMNEPKQHLTGWRQDDFGIIQGDCVVLEIDPCQIFQRCQALEIGMLAAAAPDLLAALEHIVEMNRMTARDQYGDAEKAESWSCVQVARAAIEKAMGGPK